MWTAIWVLVHKLFYSSLPYALKYKNHTSLMSRANSDLTAMVSVSLDALRTP